MPTTLKVVPSVCSRSRANRCPETEPNLTMLTPELHLTAIHTPAEAKVPCVKKKSWLCLCSLNAYSWDSKRWQIMSAEGTWSHISPYLSGLWAPLTFDVNTVKAIQMRNKRFMNRQLWKSALMDWLPCASCPLEVKSIAIPSWGPSKSYPYDWLLANSQGYIQVFVQHSNQYPKMGHQLLQLLWFLSEAILHEHGHKIDTSICLWPSFHPEQFTSRIQRLHSLGDILLLSS